MKIKKENNLIKIDLALIAIGFLLLILIHFLREDGSFIQNSLSNYAASEYGYIANITFYIFALVNFIVGFLSIHLNNKKTKLISYLFFHCTAFIILLTVFHTNGNGLIENYREYIHAVSAILLFLTYPIIMLISGFQYKTNLLRRYSFFSFFISIFLAISGIVFTINNLKSGLLETTFLGLFEKVGVIVILVWMIVYLISRNKLIEIK